MIRFLTGGEVEGKGKIKRKKYVNWNGGRNTALSHAPSQKETLE